MKFSSDSTCPSCFQPSNQLEALVLINYSMQIVLLFIIFFLVYFINLHAPVCIFRSKFKLHHLYGGSDPSIQNNPVAGWNYCNYDLWTTAMSSTRIILSLLTFTALSTKSAK